MLEEFDFTISHRPGKAQDHVDSLSRLPLSPRVAVIHSKEKEVKEIITQLHRATHAGADATYQLLRQHYPGIGKKKWCQQVVAECQGCQFGKDYRKKHAPKGHIQTEGPWEMVSVDVVGPLPENQGK